MGEKFLDNKYSWLFRFFDTSKNGHLEVEDFRAKANRAAQAVADFFQKQENGQQFLDENLETIKAEQLKAYEELFKHTCDEVGKGEKSTISLDDWLNFCKHVSKTVKETGELPPWFQTVLENYYDNILDFNKNGAIDLYEMMFMGDAPIDVAWYCFDRITDGGTIPLDKKMFIEQTKKYFSCEEPSDKSRYMYGFIEGVPA